MEQHAILGASNFPLLAQRSMYDQMCVTCLSGRGANREPASSAQGYFPLPRTFVRPWHVYRTLLRNLICMDATIIFCSSEQASGQASGQADLQSDNRFNHDGRCVSQAPHREQ